MQWFSTPRLADGEHNITISNLYGTAIDYAVVTVGNDTSLIEQTIVTDGDSPLVQYSGQWSRNTSEFIPGSLPPGYPYGNATHLSSNPGDTFTFQFNGEQLTNWLHKPFEFSILLGTSIAVYGIFSWNNLGLLSATYSIDNSTYSSSIPVTTSSQGYLNQDGEVSNYQYFGLNSLSPGVHTLLVNITEANNQTFMLNYITYSPAFDTLASLPSLSSSASGSSTSYTSSTTSSLPSTTPTISSDMSRRSVPTILGGVILALVFSVFGTIMLVSLILRRRRVREQKLAFQHEILTDGYNPDCLFPLISIISFYSLLLTGTRQHEPGFLTGNSHTQYIHPTDSQHA